VGLRFRRSISIAPGIRLNVSGSGLSATLGPRGASVNVGPRSTFLNTGLPGTGLYARQRLSQSGGRSEARTTYRQLQMAAREAEKLQQRQEASAEHADRESRLHTLQNVLLERNRQDYDWARTWSSQGKFIPASFPDIAAKDIDQISKAAAAGKVPITRWIFVFFALSVPSFIWGSITLRASAAVGLVLALFWARKSFRARKEIAQREHTRLSEEFRVDRIALQLAHDAKNKELQESWDAEEVRFSRIRTAPANSDLESLAGVLDIELNNEVFPVPLILELELVSVSEARIEFVLPELSEVPEERTQLTKTGKLSARNMAQRDRVSLYGDLCTGMALRLLHETCRVLEIVQTIELFGTASGIDQANGHPHHFVALRISVGRAQLGLVNMDGVDASSAFGALGGTFACDRRGDLTAIPGVTGFDD
jgi:hypothetical protein